MLSDVCSDFWIAINEPHHNSPSHEEALAILERDMQRYLVEPWGDYPPEQIEALHIGIAAAKRDLDMTDLAAICGFIHDYHWVRPSDPAGEQRCAWLTSEMEKVVAGLRETSTPEKVLST